MITYLFKGKGQELYKFIRPLMYKGLIKEVIKENYVSKYSLENKKIVKTEYKKVSFISDDENKLKDIIKKNNNFESLQDK